MDKEITDFKVSTKDLCVKCAKELKTISLGSSDIFGLSGSGRGAFYCENPRCDFMGLITLAHRKHTEKKPTPKPQE